MANMTLGSLEFLRLLPAFMREDGAVIGLAKAVDELTMPVARAIKKLTTWDNIDTMSESELDEMAWELNILWYDSTASVAAKREVVKNSDLVYKRLGTQWAVENVIQSYFGDGYVSNWYEYGGEAGHFRIYSSNPSINAEKLTEFLSILEKVKRKSAVLDGIYINLTMSLSLYGGTAFHETGHETYGIGYQPI